MSKHHFRRPRHATIVAYLALFVALGGTAAIALPGKNSVESDDIRKNAVKGVDVNERSLKGVLGCPSGLRGHEGICVDRSSRPATAWESALGACADRKLRLPTLGEALVMVRRVPRDGTLYWTDSSDTSDNDTTYVAINAPGLGPSVGVTGRFENHSYRCVTAARD